MLARGDAGTHGTDTTIGCRFSDSAFFTSMSNISLKSAVPPRVDCIAKMGVFAPVTEPADLLCSLRRGRTVSAGAARARRA